MAIIGRDGGPESVDDDGDLKLNYGDTPKGEMKRLKREMDRAMRDERCFGMVVMVAPSEEDKLEVSVTPFRKGDMDSAKALGWCLQGVMGYMREHMALSGMKVQDIVKHLLGHGEEPGAPPAETDVGSGPRIWRPDR